MTARIVATGFVLHVKSACRSVFYVSASLIEPMLIATVVLLMADAGGKISDRVPLVLGAGLVGMWSSALFGAGTTLQALRHQSVLPQLVGAPAPLLTALIPLCLASTAIGVYSFVAALAWAMLAFGIAPAIADLVGFGLALVATVGSLAALGLLLSTAFVHFRNASAFANALEFPIWLLSGFFIPVAALPHWLGPITWMLAPSWGAEALRAAAAGGSPAAGIAMSCALAALYLAAAALLLRAFERAARKTATLSLA
jgi:ABC-2 type transport system permease protein